ncbi:MAG TPA: STAS domain-containing protein, partial [Mycobacteriales bacterium]|nr:STAS domain-containing protein [Mycobacteriales bacterium]
AQGVVVSGELDLASAPRLEAAVCAAYQAAHPLDRLLSGCRFLLDLSELTFLDSDGISALHAAHLEVEQRGDQLHVAGPTASGPQRLLALAVANGWLGREFARGEPTRRTAPTG